MRERIQDSGFRIQNWGRRMGRGLALLAVAWAAGCAAPPAPRFTDADWVSHVTTGRGAYERGDYRRAADAYGRAQQRARALDDADALAISAVNRATALVAAGQAADAVAGLDEALADARIEPARRAELLVAAARAEQARGQPGAALERVAAALRLDPPPALRAQARLAQAGAELARKEPAAATQALAGRSANEWARLPESLQAERAEMRAAIAVVEQKPADALASYDEAARLWKQAGRLPEMARALAAAGRQAQAAADLAGAAERFYRAARSLWAQGLLPEAVRVLEEGVEAAERLDDEAVAKKMAELYVTFKESQRLEK